MNATSLPVRLFEIVSNGDLDALGALLHPGFVSYGTAGQALDADGMRAMITEFRTAFPDIEVAAVDVVADGDRIAWRVDGYGTHTGPFLGIPPTGRRVRLLGVDLAVVEDARIRTHWSGEDLAGVLMQLGALPAPTPPEPQARSRSGTSGSGGGSAPARASRSAHSSSGAMSKAVSSMPACRSPRRANRSGMVAIVKSPGSASSISSQPIGADTRASGTPRTE